MKKTKRVRCFAAGLALCMALAAQPLMVSAMTSIQTEQIQSEILLLAADYSSAEAKMTQILQADPTNIVAYLDRAKARGEQQNFEGSYQDYRQAVLLAQARPMDDDVKDWLYRAVEESNESALTNFQFSLWLKYFGDLTITSPDDDTVDLLETTKEDCQYYNSIYSQLPAGILEKQIQQSSDYQEAKQQDAAERQKMQQREKRRQAALAGMNQSYYSQEDETEIRYGSTGIQLTESNGSQILYILSQPMQSAQCASHEIICYVPAGTVIEPLDMFVGVGNYGYAEYQNTHTIAAGQTVKLRDDSQDREFYYNVTIIGV